MEEATQTKGAPAPTRSKARARKVAARAGQSFLGLTVALVVAEGAFCARDRRAFPHLNVYVADPELGVRLRPGARERVSFQGNPVTEVRINQAGLRGDELPPPGKQREILVLGDSQVFGLGVQEDETFSAVLERHMAGAGALRVINAGVPTYGPMEYDALLEKLLKARTPETVVLVINFANDLFEAGRPNVDRHVVWDGWAVRKETAPTSVFEFPGRSLLFRESHLVYALRAWMHRDDPPASELRLPSEGSWQDLVQTAGAPKEAPQGGAEAWTSALEKARKEAIDAQVALETAAKKSFPKLMHTQAGEEWLRTHGNPGDIVVVEKETQYHGEASEPVTVTAKKLIDGAKVRAQIEASLKKLAGKDAQKGKDVLASFEARQAVEKRLAELEAKELATLHASSPLRPAIERAKALCDAHGARLVVVALPLDVQVSSAEWAKYGEKETDMRATLALERDLMETAALLHVDALDVTPALVAAEPGAFLHGDIHMTPKGHDAVAAALAQYLQAPKAAPATLAPLPPDRSAPPIAAEWETGTPLEAKALPKGCSVRTVREWVRLFCGGKSRPTDVVLAEGGHGEAMVFRYGPIASALAPAMPGESLAFEVAFGKARRRFVVRRDGDDFSLTVKKLEPGPPDLVVTTPNAEAACACSQIETGDASCGHLLGAPDPDCARTYAGDCKKLLRCLAGEPSAPPVCLPDWTNAGGARHCFKRCDAGTCAVGTCTSWQGARVCMGGAPGAS